ncbi:MAG: chromosomal replication initiator protein DnaA [Acutalibacteraceae bacterium]|nr:chromosomal replication initiator protein DnaA [Acutalibacteraceae bacterium]
MEFLDTFNEAWDVICDYLKNKKENGKKSISDVAYNAWIKKIQPVGLDFETSKIVLSVPNKLNKTVIENSYLEILKIASEEVFGKEFNFIIEVAGEDIKEEHPQKEIEEESGDRYGDEYTFDTYVVGSSNELAYKASVAVAKDPAGLEVQNPLLIYGNSGLGKTHLLYAIKNVIAKNYPEKKIIYVKGEDFTNELIESLSKKTADKFRDKYRTVDVLLVDDIQFIAGKEATQEEFFHTFNTLYEARKQIVFTSDVPPKEMKTLEDRLKSRFEWGLLADIQPPDIETRITIINKKAEQLNIEIPYNISELIATKIKTNIRKLEGAVKKLHAKNMLNNEKISIKMAHEVIAELQSEDVTVEITLDTIVEEVARTFSVTPEEIKSSNRRANLSRARQIAIYLVKDITNMSMEQIGAEFNGRHHSTIVYTCQQVEKNMETDPKVKEIILNIKKNLQSNQ